MTLSWRTKNYKNQQQFSFFLLRKFFSDILCLKYPPTNVFYIYHTWTAQDFGSNCLNSVFPETCFDQRPAALVSVSFQKRETPAGCCSQACMQSGLEISLSFFGFLFVWVKSLVGSSSLVEQQNFLKREQRKLHKVTIWNYNTALYISHLTLRLFLLVFS